MELKEKYQKIAEKHKLPSFDELDKEFELADIEKEEFILREIRRKIAERLDLYAKILEPVLQPEACINDMHECKVFNDSKKKKIYDIYTKLMYFNRFSIETSIDENDETSSTFINAVWGEWGKLKEVLKDTISELKESWLDDSDIKEDLGYMG